MLTLEIDNSTSRLQNLTPQQFAYIKNILSYKIDQSAAYFSGNHYNQKRYLIDKTGAFPTGLLYLVDKWINFNRIPCVRTDRRKVPKTSTKPLYKVNTRYPLPTPYQDQIHAVEAALRAHRGVLSMPTGSGKSVTMALLCKTLNLKTLIVVPNLELKRQLSDCFNRWFGTNYNITIENIDSTTLLKETDYDVLIIDEAHHAAAKTYRDLNKFAWNKIYYRFFFTATPFRSRNEEQLLFESVAGEVIYRLTYEDAVKRKYIVPIEAYYVEVPETSLKGVPERWASVYNKLVVNNVTRNELLRELLVKFHASKSPTLCLVKEIAHGESLVVKGIPFVNGQDDTSRPYIDRFNLGSITTLIGTNGVLGEGVDTKPAEIVIIAGLGKAKSQFMQACGRGVRTYPGKTSCQIIIFLDKSHKWSENHFKEQCRILKTEYGVIPTKLSL